MYYTFASVGDYAGRQVGVLESTVGTVRAKSSSSSAFCGVNVFVANPAPRGLDTNR